jgi:hypothetical protein
LPSLANPNPSVRLDLGRTGEKTLKPDSRTAIGKLKLGSAVDLGQVIAVDCDLWDSDAEPEKLAMTLLCPVV